MLFLLTSFLTRERHGAALRRANFVNFQVLVSGDDNVRDSLIWVDRPAWRLAVEEVRKELDNTGDPDGTTDKDDLVYVGLIDLGVPENLLDRLKRRPEEILAQLLESRMGDRGVKVDTLIERVNFDGHLRCRRQCTLRTLASGTESAKSTRVR
ncbi:hypothetical protein ACEPAF_1109 [Sanghuangporus sanghuang]